VTDTFFTRLKAETPTRIWVNNPTRAEVELALQHGAIGCTTNPSFSGSLLHRDPDKVRPLIAVCARLSANDETAAEQVQLRLVAEVVDRFRPAYEASGGSEGFVSIQGSPETDDDSGSILAAARAGRALGPNATPKLPATGPGLAAFEAIVAEGWPTIVTEVFSLDQLVETNERYLRVTARSGVRPPFFISPITGIFGDHLRAVAGERRPEADQEWIQLAGVALSRACHKLVDERGYPATLLCGGARGPVDVIGLVGLPVHLTVNWTTVSEILDQAPVLPKPGTWTIDPATIAQLRLTFGDFDRAMRVGSLRIGDFEDFGPVRHFRSNFQAAWRLVRAAIAAERSVVTT